MARAFTPHQRQVLRSGAFKLRILLTFWLDDGPTRFCDDVEDLYYENEKYLGASGFLSCTDIKSGSGLVSEPVSIILDGTRLNATGVVDPAELFRDILKLKLHQRRVDIYMGISPVTDPNIMFKKPVYAGKINNARVVDSKLNLESVTSSRGDASPGNLEIVLDSLAARYNRVTGRTRSHADQQSIDPTDMFYSFVQGLVQTQQNIYWGKADASGAVGLPRTTYGGSPYEGIGNVGLYYGAGANATGLA